MNAEGPPQQHVLVVDDDSHTRTLLVDLCEASGFRTSQAEDGEAALEVVSRIQPDLVLLDLMMPKRDGFSVLKVLRENASWADLPVILLTAMGDMDGKIRGMELGADDYVTKPFKLVELQTRIKAALTVRDYRKRLVAAEEELSQLRVLDPVTGAGTYAQLKASLDGELARSRRYGRAVSALLIGFDDYQALRYELGRDGSDHFVAKLAAALRSTMRGADRLFRIDNDEFVLLLPETDFKGAHIAAERILTVLESTTADGKTPGTRVRMKARIGGATFPHEHVRSSEDLLREANRSYRLLVEQNRFLFHA